MAELYRVKLGDIITFKNGKKKPAGEGNIPIYGGNGVLGYANDSNYSNCIIIGRVGAYCGSVYYERNSCWISDNAIAAIPTKDVDIYFIYYLLRGLQLNSRHIGTSQPLLTQEILNKIECRIPAIEVQAQISNLLRIIDGKIQVNTRINRNLSGQASILFDEWFGRYLSDGVDIPRGWRKEEIGNLDILVTDYVANGSFKSLADNVQYQSEETDNVLIRLTDYNNNYSSDMVYITDSAYEFLAKSKLYGDEIIISNVGANVGTVFRCPRLEKRMSLGPNSIMLRAKELEHYLFLYFTSVFGQHQLQAIVTGSAQPKFNKTNFRTIKILVPAKDIIIKFNDIYSQIYSMITKNSAENKKLADLRDNLLSRLMSGKLDVNNLKV